MNCRLKRRSPIASLRNNKAFRQVYQGGRHTAGPLFVIYTRKQDNPGAARLGVSVSKKIGNAVTRNLVKRLVKESCRLRGLPDGRDYVVAARAGAGLLPRETAFSQVDTALGQLLARLGVRNAPRSEPASEEAERGFTPRATAGLGAGPH
jgi:ribonuclease P protein component